VRQLGVEIQSSSMRANADFQSESIACAVGVYVLALARYLRSRRARASKATRCMLRPLPRRSGVRGKGGSVEGEKFGAEMGGAGPAGESGCHIKRRKENRVSRGLG
jgi:hypothetical protein